MSGRSAMAVAGDNLIYKKIGWRLVPFLLVCYMMAAIDRFNIGFAKLQFLHDLGLNNAVYGVAAGFFYVGYISCEVPSNLWLARIGVRKTLLRIMLLWGAVTSLMMLAHSAYAFYILRFLLGVAEAGFFPGILFYLTIWFPDRLRGRVTSLFVMAAPISGIVGGPLAGWIMQSFQGVYGLRGWQWLFFFEGIPAILLGVIAYFYLCDQPASASWLSAEEKRLVVEDINADRLRRPAKADKSFRGVLRDPKVYLMAIIYFAYFCSLNTYDLWSPSVMRAVGVQKVITIGWYSGITHLIGTAGMVAVGYSSDRHMERRWHVALCGLSAAVCFMLLPLGSHSIGVTVLLLSIAAIGIYGVLGLFWTIPSAYLEQGSAAAGGIALITSIGSLGGAVSPPLVGWIAVRTGSLYLGLSVIASFMIIGMVLLLLGISRRVPSQNSRESELDPQR